MKDFEDELMDLLNRCCKENESNTPDFILAKYLNSCLIAFNVAVNRREKWHCVDEDPCVDGDPPNPPNPPSIRIIKEGETEPKNR